MGEVTINIEGLQEAIGDPEEIFKVVFRSPEEGRLGFARVRALLFKDRKNPLANLDQWNCLDENLPVVFERLANWREEKLELVDPKAAGFLWVARFEIDSDHRGHGFGADCIGTLAKRAWEESKLVTILVVNPISQTLKSMNDKLRAAEKIRAVYEAAGFERAPASQLVMAWTGMKKK